MTKDNHQKNYTAGETIIQQGEEGHFAFIIESGSVEILIEKNNGLIQSVGTRGAGNVIGEMALVDNKPRTATIKAIEDCKLLQISRSDFEERLDTTDPVVKMIMQVIMARYRDMIARSHILKSPNHQPAPENLEKDLVHKTNAVDELKLIDEIKTSIENKNFILHYQPILDLKKNIVVGFESLVRWQHPEKGLIYPDQFIEIAENSGLITDLTRWITKESCRFLQRICDTFPNSEPFFISVNFTAKDFLTPNFKNFVMNEVIIHDLIPEQFHIEMTERLLMDEPHHAQEVLKECQNSGLKISIDDFGTGYSSLSYLYHYPIDILKIDRSFIQNLEQDKSSYNLVSSIISLGHNMNMSIIAEGIEKQEQSDLLQELNCDKIQGYLHSKPIPEEEIENYLRNALESNK